MNCLQKSRSHLPLQEVTFHLFLDLILILDPTPVREEQQTIPEASTALPETASTENNVNNSTTPTSPTHPSVPGPGTSEKPSTDPAVESNIPSFTQPTIAKPTDEIVPTTVDPKTDVANVSP